LPRAVVFSTALPAAGWDGSRIARGDLAEEIAVLKSESGGEIMAHGGAAFVRALSRLGLIDEYRGPSCGMRFPAVSFPLPVQ
jgi:dihydrofolate reductase